MSAALFAVVVATRAYAQSIYATPYYFTTLAGVTTSGTADGTGNAARFFMPNAVAADSNNIVYVADTNNHTIRKISPIGVVTTIAGTPGVSGTVNGNGGGARFNLPRGIAVSGNGDAIYVADTSNHTIRKITAGGVVTTLAGGIAGSENGTGIAARFLSPNGLAVDANGFVYVADAGNHSIRKISPAGVVTTLAGGLSPMLFGSVNGIGESARFQSPRGVAVDGAGNNIYVADRDNNLIRKITAAGVVTTVAGVSNGITGSADGTGTAARFNSPYGVASGPDGSVYVVDSSNATIRRIAPDGVVTTLAGVAAVQTANVDGRGNVVRFNFPQGIAIDGSGNLYVADTVNHTIRMSVFNPFVLEHPTSQIVAPGASAEFRGAGFSNVVMTYQWQKDGVPIPGATNLTAIFGAPFGSLSFLNLPSVQLSDLSGYTLVITNVAGSTTSNVATLSFPVSTAGRLTNLSILTTIPTAGDSFTMGYVVSGSGPTNTKPLVIRAVGPTLGGAPFNIPGTLSDPKIELFAGATKTGENDNWGGSAAVSAAMAGVGAFPYAGPTSLDAAIATNITSADNSVKVSATGNGTGTVIAEIYDATPNAAYYATTPRLANVSVLKNLGTGLTLGFVIGGSEPKAVLIRAVGPTLGAAPFNVGGVVADPQLTLFSGQTVIGTNDNWGGTAALTTAFSQVGAFSLPATSRDAALMATLAPGNYTVLVSGVGGTTGVAIVEVYEVP